MSLEFNQPDPVLKFPPQQVGHLELITDPGEDYPIYEETMEVPPIGRTAEALQELMDIMDGGENLARRVRQLKDAMEKRTYA
jgi:hypothetical protein